jgi:hypothetical protein
MIFAGDINDRTYANNIRYIFSELGGNWMLGH